VDQSLVKQNEEEEGREDQEKGKQQQGREEEEESVDEDLSNQDSSVNDASADRLEEENDESEVLDQNVDVSEKLQLICRQETCIYQLWARLTKWYKHLLLSQDMMSQHLLNFE